MVYIEINIIWFKLVFSMSKVCNIEGSFSCL